MNFNSFQYIIFLAVVFLPYYFLNVKCRCLLLLAASIFFYSRWSVRYTFLMLGVVGITYVSGRTIEKYRDNKNKAKMVLIATLSINIILLCYFKYTNMMINTFNSLFKQDFELLNIILPIGISFYMFQAIGYVLDVYNNTLSGTEYSIVEYALFITFFPQLVAGPIERSTNILPQLRQKKKFELDNIKDGITLILAGLILKVVIAERLSVIVDAVFSNYQNCGKMLLILGPMIFGVQIYCDFFSYTCYARGSAQLFGISLMENFNAPYLSESIGEYWSRWHISLSKWFEDYIYNPFVWNSPNRQRSIYTGFILVFVISGFWHGANWTYVTWGLIHGIYRVIGALTKKPKRKLYKKYKINQKNKLFIACQIICTFCLVSFTYIFFRASSMNIAIDYIKSIFTHRPSMGFFEQARFVGMNNAEYIFAYLMILLVFIYDMVKKKNISPIKILNKQNIAVQGICYALMFMLVFFFGMYGSVYASKPFIYFQF